MRDVLKPWQRFALGLAMSSMLAMPLWATPGDSAVDPVEEKSLELQRAMAEDTGGEAKKQGDGGGQSSLRKALERLTIHGYLTQAYAEGSFVDGGPVTDELALGIPEDGTTAYRNLAIQFRYEISDRDIMVVQFSSRSLGDTPGEELEDDVELDWAFYERRLTDNTSIKLGRVQIPLGIFNEIRDVGTLLPFYRPAYTFYNEGTFTSETIDGVVLSHTFFPLSEWALEADVYYGEYDLVELAIGAAAPAAIATSEDAIGFQLWLNTPVDGLRFGVGAEEHDTVGGQEGFVRPVDGNAKVDSYHLSLDYAGEKFVVRSEFRSETLEETSVLFEIPRDDFYVQVGYHFTDAFRVYAQYEERTSDFDRGSIQNVTGLPVISGSTDIDAREDIGFALNYLFAPNLVLKLEYHQVEAGQLLLNPVFVPEFPFPIGFDASQLSFEDGDYWILSFSASF
ncbi:MAG: hypothetical protein AAGD38_13880 [Acidobacteriota bacterium]